MLTIHLFGPAQAKYFDRPLPGFPGHQTAILLSYILLSKKRPHLRDRLATIFWGDYPNEVARKYLRNSLWKLRQVFEGAGADASDYLLVSEDSVMFINTSDYWLDIEQFETCLAECRPVPADSLSEAQATRLESALALYTGDLLENVYADWCLEERERLRQQYLGGLQKMMLYHSAKGHYQRAVQYGRQILVLDKAQERTHRQLMLLHAVQGNRNAAIAQYQLLRQHLRDELNLQPMVETQRLYDQIIHNQGASEKAALSNEFSAAGSPSAEMPHLQIIRRIQQLQNRMDEINQEVSQLEHLLGRMLDQMNTPGLDSGLGTGS